MEAFSFNAILSKITTTIDGGWRVSFDLPQSEKEAIMQLSELRDVAFQVGIVTSEAIANFYPDCRSKTDG